MTTYIGYSATDMHVAHPCVTGFSRFEDTME